MLRYLAPSRLANLIFGGLLATVAGMIAGIALPCPWNVIAVVVIVVLGVGYILTAIWAERDNAHRDTELFKLRHLSDLERRTLLLAGDLSKIGDAFLNAHYPIGNKLFALSQLYGNPTAISQLPYTHQEVINE